MNRPWNSRRTSTFPESPTSAEDQAEPDSARHCLEWNYRIEYLERAVVAVDIPRPSRLAQRRIKQAIETKLSAHPLEFGKPLRYSLKGARRLRVGDYRAIFTIEPDDLILVVKIGHRRDVYGE